LDTSPPSFQVADCVLKNPARLIDFLFVHHDMKELSALDCGLLSLSGGQSFIKRFLDGVVRDGKLSLSIIRFLTYRLANVGALPIDDKATIISTMDSVVFDPKKQEDFNLMLEFVDKFGLGRLFVGRYKFPELPQFSRHPFMSLLLSKHLNELQGQLSLGLLVDLISNWSSEHKKFAGFISAVLFADRNARINHYRMLIDRSVHSFVVTVDAVLATLQKGSDLHWDQICRAVHSAFIYIAPRTLLLRVVPAPLDPLSEDTVQLIEELLLLPPTKEIWTGLREIADALPIAFAQLPNLTLDSIIKMSFAVTDRFAEYFESEDLASERAADHLNAAVAALAFTTSLSALPQFLDLAVPRIIGALQDDPPCRVLASALFLTFLMNTPTVQNILVAFMLKNKWNGLLGPLIVRMSSEGPTKLTKFALDSLLNLTSHYVSFLNGLNQFSQTITDELIRIDQPFQTLYQGYITTLSPEIPTFDCVLRAFKLVVPNTVFRGLKPFRTHICHRVFQKDGRIPEPVFRQFASMDPPSAQRIWPNFSSADIIRQLPVLQQATLLSHLIRPAPRSLTPEMHRYLLHQPAWVMMWIDRFSGVLVMPDHYAVLGPALQDLERLPPETADRIAVAEYRRPGLLSALVAELPDPAAISLLSLLAEDGDCLETLIDVVTQRIRSGGHHKIGSLLKLLLKISSNPDFRARFSSSCLQLLTDSLTITTSSSEIMHLAVQLAFKLEGPVPRSIIQAVAYLLSTDTNDLDFFELVGKLPPNIVRDNLMHPLEHVFLGILHEDLQKVNLPLFRLFMEKFSFLADSHRPELIRLLDSIFVQRNQKNLKLIQELCQCLCPRQGDSGPAAQPADDDPSSGGLHIPNSLFQQAEDFWSVIVRHISYFEHILQSRPDSIRSELKWLMNFPEVLTLEPKLNIFRSLQRTKICGRSVDLYVRRTAVLDDSFRQLRSQYPGKAILGRLHVTFDREEGYDVGGVTRDWYTAIVAEFFNPDYGLFLPTLHGRSYIPNPSSSVVNSNSLVYFELTGRVIARALIDNCQVDVHLSQGFLKQILGRANNLRDVQEVSIEVYESLLWILQNDPAEAGLTFAREYDVFGKIECVELKPGGKDILVTTENRDEYVQCLVDQILKNQASEQTAKFIQGFREIIPVDEIKMFRPDELDLLICGVPEIDVDDLIASCEFSPPYSPSHPVIQRLVNVLRGFSSPEKAQFLLYVTGSSQMPVGGLRNLAYRAPLTITPGPPPSHLPLSHTCYHQLELPAYPDEATQRTKLVLAMTEGTTFAVM
jgi:E3 ubiquitin-protein ligase HUWE1